MMYIYTLLVIAIASLGLIVLHQQSSNAKYVDSFNKLADIIRPIKDDGSISHIQSIAYKVRTVIDNGEFDYSIFKLFSIHTDDVPRFPSSDQQIAIIIAMGLADHKFSYHDRVALLTMILRCDPSIEVRDEAVNALYHLNAKQVLTEALSYESSKLVLDNINDCISCL